ncbi:uncharacterized protein PHA67_018522 [Liasis olivaceus]
MMQLLGLCLFCIQLTRQETCSSPGNLPSPHIYLNNSSRGERDTMCLRCKIPPLLNFTRVIFCKDGKKIESYPQKKNTFAYNFCYKISQKNTTTISCMYQFKDLKNQFSNSGLSNVVYLQQVLEDKHHAHFVGLGIGITAAILIFAIMSYVMKKKGVLKWRATREQYIPSGHTEMESQPDAYSFIRKNQQIQSLEEGDSADNALHLYSEVTSNKFIRTSSQEEKPQMILLPVYSCVNIMRKGETHYVPSFCEEER